MGAKSANTRLVLCLILAVHSQLGLFFELPEVKIEVLNPKGLKVSVPDSANLTSFAFHGNVNKDIGQTDVGELGQELLSSNKTEDKWVIEFPDRKLNKGDVIRYFVFVSVDGRGYIKDGMTYVVGGGTVPAESQPTSGNVPVAAPPCAPSITSLRGKPVCKGQVIFEDDFSGPLSDKLWLVEQYIPEEHLEYPFISYQHNAVSVSDGNLRIHPELQQNMEGYNNASTFLDLSKACTGRVCSKFWDGGHDILPPVASGRVRSRFSFKYGRIDIRAKLPLGDWLYPEILLEPLHSQYGKNGYASGLINIARARGNKELIYSVISGGVDYNYGNKVWEGGLVISQKCPSVLKRRKELSDANWADKFHVYSVVWTPDSIQFIIDGSNVFEFAPSNDQGFAGYFKDKGCYDLPKSYRDKISPFDEEFYLVLGVAAGGNNVFPDYPKKPWVNGGTKSKLDFWKNRETWYPTWKDTSNLLVDSVKITAL